MDMDISDIKSDGGIEDGLRGRNIMRVKPQVQEMEEEEDMFEDMDDGVSPAKHGRFPERCRFWPACMKGDACPFHHPSTPCMKFPRCSFGDKCGYIHPKCRYDGHCTRKDCMYMHTAKNSTGGLPRHG